MKCKVSRVHSHVTKEVADISTSASQGKAESNAEDKDDLRQDQEADTTELTRDDGGLTLIGIAVLENLNEAPDQEEERDDYREPYAEGTSVASHVTYPHEIKNKKYVVDLHELDIKDCSR